MQLGITMLLRLRSGRLSAGDPMETFAAVRLGVPALSVLGPVESDRSHARVVDLRIASRGHVGEASGPLVVVVE